MQTINYQLILDELLKGVRPSEELEEYSWMDMKQFISEFRTVGFTSSRQTGKTEFIASLVDQGKAVVITHESCINNVMNDVRPVYADRIFGYEKVKAEDFEPFKGQGITFICLDESHHFSVVDEMYDKLADVFGDKLIVIRC